MMIIRTVVLTILLLSTPFVHAGALPGMVDYAQVYNLSTGVHGVVKTVSVKPGDRVLQGTLLLALDTAALNAKLNALESRREYLRAKLDEEERAKERDEALYDEGSLSTVELSNREIGYLDIKADYEKNAAKIARINHKLAMSKIVAPESGVVLKMNAAPTMSLSKNTQNDEGLIVFASDRKQVRSVVNLPVQQSLPNIGESVEITVTGQEAKLAGIVKVIDSVTLPGKVIVTIDSQEELPAPGVQIKVGF